MKAIILAAGEGVRMRPLTLKTPKPLLPVNGRPIMEYIFDSFPLEIDEVIITVRYLGDQIKNHFGVRYQGRLIRYVLGSHKGNAYSFLATKKYLNGERFLLVQGDELTHRTDIHNCLKYDSSILVFEPKDPSSCGMAHLGADGTVKRIIEKPKRTSSRLAIDGVMVLKTEIFNYKPIRQRGEFYFSTMVGQFARDHKMVPVPLTKTIIGITRPHDLKRAGQILKKRKN